MSEDLERELALLREERDAVADERDRAREAAGRLEQDLVLARRARDEAAGAADRAARKLVVAEQAAQKLREDLAACRARAMVLEKERDGFQAAAQTAVDQLHDLEGVVEAGQALLRRHEAARARFRDRADEARRDAAAAAILPPLERALELLPE